MIEAKTVLELYEGHPERWTTGEIATDTKGNSTGASDRNAVCWCLFGATFLVYGSEGSEKRSKLRELTPQRDIIQFNDTHTFDEVLDLVRKAGI